MRGQHRRGWRLILLGLLVVCAGCANSRPIYVPRPRFDAARPERLGPSRSPLLRRRSDPMELRVDPPVIEAEPEVQFEPAGSGDPPLVIDAEP